MPRRSRDVRKAVALALAVAALFVPAAAADAPDETLLALVSPGTRVELVRLDPVSLAPVAGVPRVRVGIQDLPWALSPDESLVALGSMRSTSLILVDLHTMQAVGRIGTAFQVALAWPERNRLLIFERGAFRWRLTLVDPIARSVLLRRKLGEHGDIVAAATTRNGLAILMAPGRREGHATLLALDARGGARRVGLRRIVAGTVKKQLADGRYRSWYRRPALAVDAEGGRAYVVTAGARVAEVDLATLAVSYREARLEAVGAQSPAAVSTGSAHHASSGTFRQAHWLGDGLIATAGWTSRVTDSARGPEQNEVPAGLALLDTRVWTSRRLFPDARWFHATPDLVLARARPRKRAGTVLAGFAHEGAARFRLQLDTATFGVQSAGPYAYLGLGDAYRPHRVTVVDTRTGEPVGTPQAPGWTLLVSPSQPQFCSCYTGTTVD